MKNIVALITLIILASCATPYQQHGALGGYSDVRIDSNTFKVQFSGNAYTSRETVEIYALLRCAEVTLDAGLDYFVLVGQRGEVNRHSVATPGYYQSSYYRGTVSGFYIPSQFIESTAHGTFVTIKAFRGTKPDNILTAYDAREIMQYLGARVKGTPPEIPPRSEVATNLSPQLSTPAPASPPSEKTVSKEYWCWGLGIAVKTEQSTTVTEFDDVSRSTAKKCLKIGDEVVKVGKENIATKNAYEILTKKLPTEEDGLVPVMVQRNGNEVNCRIKPN